jgi:very-short-patch-repair endonuclease/predicted transcriptional regulator of viral defense system
VHRETLDVRTKTSTLAAIAARQHGVVTRAQLLAAGFEPAAVSRWARAGRLCALHRGVFSVGYISPSPYASMMAAVLACGPRSAISHLSAAALWEIIAPMPDRVDVTTMDNRGHRGIVVHITRRLTPEDVTRRHNIPVTTLARTLVDLASTLDTRALARALNEARVRHRLHDMMVERALDAMPRRKGAARLRVLLEPNDAPTRSALEDRFLELVARHGLPRPEVNQRVAGYEVDMLWREARLIVELDGRRYHQTRFEQDRERDAELLAAGYRVVRVTWRRIVEAPGREAARLARMLDPGPRYATSRSSR